ncbi:hypothetical protein AB0953_32675 [Streptomyces sp. NPDC046866]|uniref:hypothetical protein n=1 Tax=Streptomyces sp. NPDC046866 TaxID=3154921 RepID=UPI003457224A
MPSWLDFVDNPETVRAVYRAQAVPELDAVVLGEVMWQADDDPALLIRFDLPVYPADPPRRWAESGFDTVQVQLRLVGAATGWRQPATAIPSAASRFRQW